MEGKVKFFNKTKGFGFIAGEDGKEYFVHLTGLKEGTMLRENDAVTFDPVKGDRGMKAINVALKGKGGAKKEEPEQEEYAEEGGEEGGEESEGDFEEEPSEEPSEESEDTEDF